MMRFRSSLMMWQVLFELYKIEQKYKPENVKKETKRILDEYRSNVDKFTSIVLLQQRIEQ